MSLLEYLQLQPVEPDDQNSPLDEYSRDETFSLNECPEDEAKLEEFWNRVYKENTHEDYQMLKNLSDEKFDALITRAMDELPQKYIKGLDNVAIVMADQPTTTQKHKMKIDDNKLLLGLYEGVPLTKRGAGYTFVLPDKITLFKNQLLACSHDESGLFENIKRTLWHEMAHYYGLDHRDIDKLENRSKIK